MQEAQVTIDGETHVLTPPFMTFATQNPIEHDGTYPLPEAQLDRFLLKVLIDYPQADHEAWIVKAVSATAAGRGLSPTDVPHICNPEDIIAAQQRRRRRGCGRFRRELRGESHARDAAKRRDLARCGHARCNQSRAHGQGVCTARRPHVHHARRCETRRAARAAPPHPARARSRHQRAVGRSSS